jgi:hypothetical protein
MVTIAPLLKQCQMDETRRRLRRAEVANAGDAHAKANAQMAQGLAALRQEARAEQGRPWKPRLSWSRRTPLPCAASAACW